MSSGIVKRRTNQINYISLKSKTPTNKLWIVFILHRLSSHGFRVLWAVCKTM